MWIITVFFLTKFVNFWHIIRLPTTSCCKVINFQKQSVFGLPCITYSFTYYKNQSIKNRDTADNRLEWLWCPEKPRHSAEQQQTLRPADWTPAKDLVGCPRCSGTDTGILAPRSTVTVSWLCMCLAQLWQKHTHMLYCTVQCSCVFNAFHPDYFWLSSITTVWERASV